MRTLTTVFIILFSGLLTHASETICFKRVVKTQSSFGDLRIGQIFPHRICATDENQLINEPVPAKIIHFANFSQDWNHRQPVSYASNIPFNLPLGGRFLTYKFNHSVNCSPSRCESYRGDIVFQFIKGSNQTEMKDFEITTRLYEYDFRGRLKNSWDISFVQE